MERIILRKGAYLLLLLLVSCTSELEKDYVNSNDIDNIVMQTTGFRAESSSRTYPSIDNGYVNILWSENDVVGVFPNEGSQAAFPMSSAAGTTQASFNGGGWALKASYKYAAYYPYEFDNKDYTKIPVSYLGQKQIGKNTSTHTGAYNYMVASATTPSEGKANFTFQNMGCMVIMDLNVPEPTTLSTVVLSADGEKFTTKGEINIMEEAPTITPTAYSGELRIDLENFTTTSANEVVTIYFMTAPINLYGKTINVRVYDNKGNLQETGIAGKNLEAGGFYSLVGTLPTVPIISNVFTVPQAGQLSTIVPAAQKNVITEMKIIGDLNGDDIRFIREMAGRDVDGNETSGQLQKLDLSEANIVEGGAAYYSYRYTSSNVIGRQMFFNCGKLESIKLPNTVQTIEESAFANCIELRKVILPNSLTNLNGFTGCERLEEIVIPISVTTIGVDSDSDSSGSFEGCISLSNITLPNNLTMIGARTFKGCNNLRHITIPDKVKTIGYESFYDCCNLEELVIPSSVTDIRAVAFRGCTGLKEIIIPYNVTNIEENVFFGCIGLSTVTLQEGITHVDGFGSCIGLEEIVIPNSVVRIEVGAFNGCSNLSNVKMSDNIKYIGSNAFGGCNKLETIDFPYQQITYIGDYAFQWCNKLPEITVSDNITYLGKNAFEGCVSLKSFKIPAGLQSIPFYSFRNTGLTDLILEEGISIVYEYSLAETDLSELILPSTLKEIRSYGLSGNTSLSTIICNAIMPPTVYVNAFENISKTNCKLYVPASAVDAYRIADGWKECANIEAINE